MQNYSTLLVIALMVVVFYFLIMRPQKKRQQALQKTLSELTPGTRVVTSSGLFGTIVAIGPRQAVLELSPGVELTVLKQAIARVATDADEDTFADDETDVDDELAEPSVLPAEPVPAPPLAEAEPVEPARAGSSLADSSLAESSLVEPQVAEPERRPTAGH